MGHSDDDYDYDTDNDGDGGRTAAGGHGHDNILWDSIWSSAVTAGLASSVPPEIRLLIYGTAHELTNEKNAKWGVANGLSPTLKTDRFVAFFRNYGISVISNCEWPENVASNRIRPQT